MTSPRRPRKRRREGQPTGDLPFAPGTRLAQAIQGRIAQTVSDTLAGTRTGPQRHGGEAGDDDPDIAALLDDSLFADNTGRRSPDPARRAHNRLQAKLFNERAHQFDEPVPQEVQMRLEPIVAAASIRPGEMVLDVGTGTGVLLPFVLAHLPSRVVACDLSKEMLALARARFKGQVRFLQKDVVALAGSIGMMDVVICNACFGNFYDPQETLQAINALCYYGGRLVISHPLGRQFVRHLREQHPEMVTSELPEQEQLEAMLEAAGFRLEIFQDQPELYLAVAKKVADAEPPNPDSYPDFNPF